MENHGNIPKDIVNKDNLPALLREIEGVKVDRPNAKNMRILGAYVGLREMC